MPYEIPGSNLQSSLGSQPSSSGGDSGFSIFGWHPSLPNLGGFTAAKQLVSGVVGLPELGYRLSQGDMGAASDVATGMGQGVEGLATSIGGVAGVPFTRYNLGDEVISPLLQSANQGIPGMHGQDPNTGEDTGFKPESYNIRHGGPIAALVGDISTAATIATPIASSLGTAASAAEATAGTAAMDAAEAAKVAEATGTAEAGTAAAEAAKVAEQAAGRSAQLTKYASTAENVAHPYKYLGSRAADVVMGARDAAFPFDYNMPEPVQTASTVLAKHAEGGEVDPEQLNNAIVSSVADPHMTPEGSAAANVQGAPSTVPTPQAPTGAVSGAPELTPLEKAAQEVAQAEEAKGQPTLAPKPAPAPLGDKPVTIYRGQVVDPNVPVGNDNWTTTRSEAEAHAAASGGQVVATQVPKDVWDAAHEAATAAGDNGTHGTVGHIPPEWADTATEAPLYGKAKAAATRAARAEEEAGKMHSTVAEETAPVQDAARDAIRQSDVAQKLAIRLATPPPEWAQRLVRTLPMPVNRIIASFATPISHIRFSNLARDYARIVEVSQREAQTSPAVLAMQQAAATALEAVPGAADRWDLSHLVGEEVAKQATGSNLVAQLVHAGLGDDADVVAALQRAAANEYTGMPKELWDQMSPEARTAFTDQVNAAAAAMHGLAEQHRQLLLASRPGMQGIERAVLGDTSIPMSTTELKLYRQALQEERRSRVLQARVDDAERARVANVVKEQLIGSKMSAESQRLIDQGGVLERALQDLHDPLPLGLRPGRIATTAANILREALFGGAVWDVGRDVSNLPPDGVFVNIAHQGDIVVDSAHLDVAQAELQRMLEHPIRPDGSEYGPMVYGGNDARLHVTPHTDPTTGQVTLSVDLGMGTWGGRALPQWLATGLGEMYGAPETIHAGTGEVTQMTGQEAVRNLWSHYMGQALDPKSPLSQFAEGLRKAAEGEGMAPDAVDASLRYYMTLDYAMSRTTGDWKLGDYFKGGKVDSGLSTPTGPYQAQTVLDLTTKEGIDAAMKNHDVAAVNDYLRWYYDSHDYIEQGYRNHTVTMLNGEQRNAAEVFYDLLAVTSVMANPKTNLGRSLMAFKNMGDFMGKNHDAFTAAQALMDKLEGIPADATGKLNGTELSKRFLVPEVRKLTEGTSMANQPKYNVFDVLYGRLNLETATNKDIANLPSFWTGKPKSLGESMLSRENVLNMLDEMGVSGPGADRYRAWAKAMDDHEGAMAEMGSRQFAPITDGEDVYLKKSQADGEWANMGDGQEVTPGKFEADAQLGWEWLKDKLSRASDHVLGDAAVRKGLINELYGRAQEAWGGGTIDAHTGVRIPDDYHGDTYAVTANLPGHQGMGTYTIPETASKAEFAAAYDQALKRFKPWLDAEGAQLGVFNNGKGGIEFDPVALANGAQEVEQIGSATHAIGGAYHFRSGNGYFVQHVADRFKDADSANAAYKEIADQGDAVAKSDPAVERARQQALLEYHGSDALAKMRNFRSNLADPEGSVGVTLDSVMARMYGFSQNRWAGGDRMGVKSREIREQGRLWSQLAGRPVQGHELQALMWINTKLEIGKQDWGMLQAHLDMAQQSLDSIIADAQAGKNVSKAIDQWDPFKDYHEEVLGYSKEAMADRKLLIDLNARYRADPKSLSPDELDQRTELKSRNLLDEVHESKIDWTAPRPKAQIGKPPTDTRYERQTRYSIPFDSGQMRGKLESEAKYQAARDQWRDLMRKGDYEGARKKMISWVTKKQRHVQGDAGGAFDIVGEEALKDPKTSSYQAVKNMRDGSGGMPAPDQWGAEQRRGSIDQLNQRTRGKLRGALLLTPDKANRLTIRLFEGAGLDTLAHEGGHLLRRMLPEEMVQRIARNPGYAHLLDTTESAAKSAAEEKFVADLHYYIRRAVRTGTHDGPLADVFEKIAATLEEQHAALMDTPYARTFSPDITDFWDNLFHPEVNPAAPAEDPLTMRTPSAGGTEVKRFRWESEADYGRRARQYGEARARIEANATQQALAARRAAKADAAVRKMQVAMTTTPTDIERQATKLHTHSQAILEKLGRSMEDPTNAQIPQEWRPMWDAFQELHRQVEENPALAEYMDEIPTTWSDVLKYAADRGFEPTYLPEMTWEQAQHRLFGHIQLGKGDPGTEMIASSRKANQGVLRKNMLGDRSIEALAAGTMDATHELYSNELVNFIETNWRKPFQSGATPPEGWVPWDAERGFILTGTRADKTKIAVGASGIIPVEVARAIKGMSNRYDHWAFHTLSKVTRPWVTYNLTLSPKWYLHVAISNVIRASLEGVRMSDWVTAYKQWRKDELPPEVMDHSINNLLRDGNHSLLGSTIKEAKQTEGMRAAIHEVRGRVSKVHDVLDEVSRAAVFEHVLNKTGSRAAALTRSYEALVDYGHLSPLERAITRSVIPFYPFYKGMLKLIARFPADHPVATFVLLQLGKMHEEYLQDQFGGKVPDAYLGYANIGGMHNFTILDPFINPIHLADPHQMSSTLNPFVDIMLRDAYNAAEPGTGQPGMDATGHKVTEVNPAAALGQDVVQAPVARLIGDVFTGGDVYKKDPGVIGGVGTYLGEPATPNVDNIKQRVQGALSSGTHTDANGGSLDAATIDQLVQQALSKAPRAARQPATAQQRLVRSIVRSKRPAKVKLPKARKPRKPRSHTYGVSKHYG